MLGHKLIQILSVNHEVTGTVRGFGVTPDLSKRLGCSSLIGGVETDNFDRVIQVVGQVRPQVIINCVGIIKQLTAASNAEIIINTNSLLPHRLANLCRACGARLIHISTDCVFSGNKGTYKESDVPDAIDFYGRTKLLGEVVGPDCLTLRTSIIGRELDSNNGLIEWFLQQGHNEVRGFRKAIYSGLTTIEFARVVKSALESDMGMSGVYHVSSNPISKYDLLLLAREAFGVSTHVIATDKPVIDRSLDSARFRREMKYAPPSWVRMMQEMAADKFPYSTKLKSW